jgi:GAF domain-containing protein
MISAPVFWGVACGAIYFLVMWWVHARRLERQRDSTRLLYELCEQVVAAHTPTGIEQRLKETLPQLLKASHVEMDLGVGTGTGATLVLLLFSHDQALGAINVYRSDGAFTDEDRAAAEHVANIVAAALQLQKHETPRDEPLAPVAPASGSGSLALIVIDPDPDSRAALLKILAARGHRAIPAAPEEAEELARRMKFDGVLRVGEEVREGEIQVKRPVTEDVLNSLVSIRTKDNN